MGKASDYELEQQETALLAQLAGVAVPTDRLSRTQLAVERRRLLLLLVENGIGQVVASPPPEEETPPPPVAEEDPEPAVIEPVILVQDSYVPDPNAFSPYNKPRLSAAGSADYMPAAVSGVPGPARFFGISFPNIATTLTFRRLEIPLRRKNVKGGELFGLHVVKKVGTRWVTVSSRYATLPANLPRMVWERTFVFPKGESWAIIWGLNGAAPDTNNIFYGDATPYPAPYANSGISYDAGMPSTTGALYTLVDTPGSHRMIRLYGVNVTKDVTGPLDPADLPAVARQFELPFYFSANGVARYRAVRPVRLAAPSAGSTGTFVYERALAATPTTYSAATFPLDLATGDRFRVTVSGLTTGQDTDVNFLATAL